MLRAPIFLIGTPRSGTTLLQCLLASHSKITSFPETHFFNRIINLNEEKFVQKINEFVSNLSEKDSVLAKPPSNSSREERGRFFLQFLDNLTILRKREIWLEKTPKHLHHMEFISKLSPDSRFIHILRQPVDTIASLCEMYREHGKIWGSSNLEHTIDRWVFDRKISLSKLGTKNHFHVCYEEVTENPVATLQSLCDFLEIPYEEQMLLKYGQTYKGLSLDFETWKANVPAGIQNRNGRKTRSVLTAEEVLLITKRCRALPLTFTRGNAAIFNIPK